MTLVSIAVSPANPSIVAGTDQQFTATGTYSDTSTADISATVTWSSATPAKATVSASGLAHGVAMGTSTISAALGGVTGSTLLTVTAPNTAPVAVADNFSLIHDTIKAVAAPGVLGNNTDADGNPLTAVLNANVTHGSLTLNADGSFSYTPNATYLGSDSFTYHANDGAANSNIVTVSLTVAPDTYYVDNTVSCSDSGAGTLALPYCTITKGATKATIGGQTVRVLHGTYAEVVKPNSGTSGNPITVSATPGVTVTGPAGNSTNGGAFRITSKSYIVVDGFTISGTADYGIILDSSNHITISNNHVSYSGTASILRSGSTCESPRTPSSAATPPITTPRTASGWHRLRPQHGQQQHIVRQRLRVRAQWGGIDVLASNYNTIIHNIVVCEQRQRAELLLGSSDNLVSAT